MFLDLHNSMSGMVGLKANDRVFNVIAASNPPPKVAIVAVGGIPILKKNGVFTLMGVEVTPELTRQAALDALGMSAVLTSMNPRNKTLGELTNMCLEKKHMWALHAFTVTLAFIGVPPFVEMSFNRDGSFMRGGSWVESPIDGPRIFTVPGDLKAWSKYLKNRDSEDFWPVMRANLNEAHDLLVAAFGEDLIG